MSEQTSGGTPSAPGVDEPEGDQQAEGVDASGGTPHPDVDQPEGGEDA